MTRKLTRDEKKDMIIEAAFKMIYNHGFEKTTLRKIAHEANLSLGSVQHFFPKQRDIYIRAMDVIFQRFKKRMEEAARVDIDTFENAVYMVKQIVQVKTEQERIENDIWVKFTLMATMNPEYQELNEAYRKVNFNFAKSIMTYLDEHNLLANPNELEEKASSLIIFITGLVFESVIYSHLYDEEIVDKRVRDYLENVCK